MFLEGKIKKYNAERGFGFIELGGDQKDLFFHIRDFPQAAGEPRLGEKLKFIMVEDSGKFKAANIVRLDLKPSEVKYASPSNSILKKAVNLDRTLSDTKAGKLFTVVGLIVIVILIGLVFQKYQSYQQSKKLRAAQLIEEQKQIIAEQRKAIGDLPEVKLSAKTERALHHDQIQPMQAAPSTTAVATQFTCDGREHCSQMGSYEEAVFFLRNCPNTKMDGDGDGIPCERQFRR
ncbi:hypothetical protein F889_01722 [Acinetobacter colistiniresistens]|uniref:CSD domain-containing protein n=1 Tax=Acinetobacter colistiniresistens TaxID=280145 RepID=N9R732_9GAMM|nr:cold shock domain-containing protein [Acinetobacter colistiniresistens]ENX34440.1 hypothetical protein F889_01722 [Acinetobacter colistiniresistens]